MKYAVPFFALLLLLSGCAQQIPVRDPEAVERVWSILHPRSAETDRLTASFSLQMETPERTGRLVGQLWGFASSIIRLDLSSGTGASVAMVQETPELWTAYIPSENKAYHHPQAQAGLDLFQIPIPLNAKEISRLLTGDLGAVLDERYSSVQGTAEGRILFSFSRGKIIAMEASESLDTLILRGKSDWTLTCEKPYFSPAFPDHQLYEKLTFVSAKNGRAVLRVKSLEAEGNWLSSDLELNLPQNVQWMRITSKPETN